MCQALRKDADIVPVGNAASSNVYREREDIVMSYIEKLRTVHSQKVHRKEVEATVGVMVQPFGFPTHPRGVPKL